MSLAELAYFHCIDLCETLADVDRVITDAESEGWHAPSSIHLRASVRKHQLREIGVES